MPVAFSFRNNVQILKFSDLMNAEEFPPILSKLEEKILQDRRQILFHLEAFKNEEDFSKSKVIQLIRFCFDRKVELALCLPHKYWTRYMIANQALAKMFATETEAISYFVSLGGENTPKLEGADAEKMRDTDLLIKNYESFHKTDELDPYHLQKMKLIYAVTPTLEAIEKLEKASSDIPQRKENIERLKEQCEQLAKQALLMSASRLIPLKDSEFILVQKDIEAQMIALTELENGLENQLKELRSEHQKIDQRLSELSEKT